MLDLAFLFIMIYVIVNANKGIYKETACNAGVVVGLLAAIVGCIVAYTNSDTRFALLNLVVALMAFGLPFAAKHLAKLHLERQVELLEQYEEERRRRMRNPEDLSKIIYDDDNFDDEELRFGKGGYTDPKL